MPVNLEFLTAQVDLTMDAYKQIEILVAKKYKKDTMSRKSIGDFMLSEDHAVNVKSNNVDKKNYSPNMISIRKMHEWVYEDRKELSFIFVDYKEKDEVLDILMETVPIPMEHIRWNCLSIEAQGYGVIQKIGPLTVDKTNTKRDFYKGFLKEYQRFREKERKKHEAFSSRFVQDPDSIDW